MEIGVIDRFNEYELRVGLGQFFNYRWEIWKNDCMVAHYSNFDICKADWKRIKEEA